MMKTTKVVGSEDCLFLNIYTSALPSRETRPLTVMVWIHGGSFIEGDNTYELYAPDLFIEQDVVLVELTYRLGIFGFFSAGDMVAPGNNGLRDQIAGLKWVKRNIREFGGNPEEITIFGESAGGVSVSLLTQTPLTKGLYKHAIMQSGVAHCNWAISYIAKQFAKSTAELLEISATSSADLKDKLKKVNYKRLLQMSRTAGFRAFGGHAFNGLFASPVIEPDHPGAVISKPILEKLRSGDFHRTPLMMGFNSMETVGIALNEPLQTYLVRSNLSSESLVPNDFDINDKSLRKQVGDRIKRFYFNNTCTRVFSEEQYINFSSDIYFNIAILETAQLVSKYTETYLYQLSYMGELGNPLRPYDYGVGHAEDLNYLFWGLSNPPLNATDKQVREMILVLWTNFAKTGNPTPRKDKLLQNIIWPKVQGDNFNCLNIDAKLNILNHPKESNYKFWKSLYSKYRDNWR
ncbi:hypothetical protein Trydic_g337 [Trypoxylus dichotomus]